jgi:nucleotide-binding universal stress UspA family protein
MSTTGDSRRSQIGCATRGGHASRSTEDYAITLARQRQADIIFLYIVDAAFAGGHTEKFDIEQVQDSLREIGRLVLEQAKERARQHGLRARGEIREGNVADEIQRFVEEHADMDVLVVGHLSDQLREHLAPLLRNTPGEQRKVVEPPQA